MKLRFKSLAALTLVPMALHAMPIVETVDYVQKKAVNHENVIMEGTLIQQVDSDEFIFQDKTGKIKVEFDDDIFGKKYNNPFPVMNTKIKIKGIVDKEWMDEIEVKIIKFKYLEAVAHDDF